MWMWSMDVETRRREAHSGRPLRTSISESCWEFHWRSWWPLDKYTRWLEQKANCWVTLNPESFAILGISWDYHTTTLKAAWWQLEGTRNRGIPTTCWIDNIVALTDQSGANLLRIARDRARWSALTHPRSQPSRSNAGEVTWHDMTYDS